MINRRRFIHRAILGVIGLSTAGFIAEAAAVLYSFIMPSKKRTTLKTFTCFSKNVQDGEAKEVHLRGNRIILVNNQGVIMAFSATCPHLGCSVVWNQKGKEFLCPCHMAKFNSAGEVLTGPPPGPLNPYVVAIEGISVFVYVPDNFNTTEA